MSGPYFIPPVGDAFRSSVPRVLYRRFEEKEHAENFLLNGDIWFRSIAYNQSAKADSIRRDPREGSVAIDAAGSSISIQIPGTDKFGAEMKMTSGLLSAQLERPETLFNSCYSYRQNSHQKKFGRWLVRINRARAWVNTLRNGFPDTRSLFWGRAEYFDERNPAELLSTDRMWLKKPSHLKKEHEFRLLFIVYGHPEGAAKNASCRLVMGDMSSYAELIEDA